ncbi:MAG: DUF1501 domain-containing protein [Actinobacteria bacterium]|nr:DUF1501 domain-containing protein [Actinomycetota bacterium]
MITEEAIERCPEGRDGFSRRQFLRGMALFGGMTVLSANGVRYTFAASTNEVPDVVVTLVLRGGFDGLSAVVPTDEALMRKVRGGIFIPNSSLLPLDREFGLHPALKRFLPLWEAKELAIVNTIGAPTHSRSHFDEIADVAYAAYGEKDKRSGWMARFLDVTGSGSVVQSVGIGSTTKQLVGGKVAPVNVNAINNFRLDSIYGYRAEDLAGFIDETHGRWTNVWATQAKSTIRALDEIAKAGAIRSNVTYPSTGTGQRFRDVAALLKAGIGVRAVDVEFQGDWDMHANMGTLENGWLTSYLADLAGSIASFREDLGVLWSRVTVVTVTEFGRRVSENQSTGTEHGWGTSIFVAGGGVNGGKIHGRFPGLDDRQLKDGDLVVTADYRSLLTEILTRRAGITAQGAAQVFPNFQPEVLSVMKHLSETPLPDNFPKNVRDALGYVTYDKDLLPTLAPVAVASKTPTASASPSQSAAEMVMPTPSASPTPTPSASPLSSAQPSMSPSPISSPSAKAISRKKTITCVKNGKTIRVTGTNPKCPVGYKIKK